jgi:hypothetical protein
MLMSLFDNFQASKGRQIKTMKKKYSFMIVAFLYARDFLSQMTILGLKRFFCVAAAFFVVAGETFFSFRIALIRTLLVTLCVLLWRVHRRC